MRAGIKMVGAKGFEPSTSWSRTRRASQAALRPDSEAERGQEPPAETFRIAQEIRPHQRTYSALSTEFRALKHAKAPCLHKKPPERYSSPAANWSKEPAAGLKTRSVVRTALRAC